MDLHLLNKFQMDFISLLKKELNDLNMPLANENIEGKKQFYFVAEIPLKNIKIWVYRDSSEFTNLKEIDNRYEIDKRYESVDYDSLNLLVDDFLYGLKAHVGSPPTPSIPLSF